MAGAIVAFSGVDTSTVFDVAPGTYAFNTSNTHIGTDPLPAITTVSANAAVLMLAAANEITQITSFSTGAAAPSGTPLAELYGVILNTSSAVGAGWTIKATAGSTGNGFATNTSASRWGAILIALRPATPTPTPTATATSTFTPHSYSYIYAYSYSYINRYSYIYTDGYSYIYPDSDG